MNNCNNSGLRRGPQTPEELGFGPQHQSATKTSRSDSKRDLEQRKETMSTSCTSKNNCGNGAVYYSTDHARLSFSQEEKPFPIMFGEVNPHDTKGGLEQPWM